MTNAVESLELTRVGPGTPMGNLMRQYWLPALQSSEVKASGDPVRLMLLGEKLIAFRDASGKVGVMDHRCPHRCASLFYGRNEGDGIACVYHGWKFNTEGACLVQPNLPPEQEFRDKVHAKTYKVREQAGVIWVYMGEREQAPPMPAIEAALLPETEVNITFTQRECNWLQALEGDIDTSHFSWLHVGSVTPEQVPDDNWVKYQVVNRAPGYEVADTEWGTMYCATRPAEDDKTYWRFAHFGFPFWTFIPQGTFVDRVIARAWVPMDDTHVMFFSLQWKQASGTKPLANGKPIPGATPKPEYQPNTTDWYGRFRPVQNASNDYLIDREAQRNNTIYTGITHIAMQDQAITESMGEIVDHSFEHLAPSDQMITRTRRRLLMAARALRDEGTVPPAVDDPAVYQKIRSGERILKADNWQTAYEDGMRARNASRLVSSGSGVAAMRVGVFDHMDRGDTPLPQFFEDRLQLCEMYDRAGFYGYHVAEHHATPLGMAPCPGIWLAAIAARTKQLRFGPLVYLLPLYHPIKLLEEICMLDQMSNGRMMLGVGRGISPIELGYYGLDPEQTPAMYQEALEVVLRGMTHKELTFEGKYYQYRNVPMEIEPLQQPTPPLWVGLGRVDAVPWAAERKINIVSNMQAAGVKAMTDRYRTEWAKLGNDPASIPLMGVGRHVVVAETEKEALEIARRGYLRWRESLMLLWIKHDMNIPHMNIAFPLTFDDAAAQNRGAAGTPDQVRAYLQRDIDEGGLNYLLCRFAFGDLTQEESVNSINLFTSRVMSDLRPAAGMV